MHRPAVATSAGPLGIRPRHGRAALVSSGCALGYRIMR